MKLTRNSITELNPSLRGYKHYFTIENAPAHVLTAMDEMLMNAGWKHDCCSCYNDGISCGWWIELSDIDEFKADYKEAKAGVKEYMAQQAIRGYFHSRVIKGEVSHDEALKLDVERVMALDTCHARALKKDHNLV